jgi:hypothetical protein
MKRFAQFLPESLVGNIDGFKITEFFFTHFEVQTPGSKGTAFTPPIAVIINPRYVL